MAKQMDIRQRLVTRLAKNLAESLHDDWEGWGGFVGGFNIDQVVERDGNLVFQGKDERERDRELVFAPVAWQKPEVKNVRS